MTREILNISYIDNHGRESGIGIIQRLCEINIVMCLKLYTNSCKMVKYKFLLQFT